MIIGLVDYPERSRSLILEELQRKGATIVEGSFRHVQKQAEQLKGENREPLIIWDEPMLIEKGYAQQVDKILEVVRFARSMTHEEQRIHLVRSNTPYDRYLMSMPEEEREQTEGAWNRRYSVMKEEIKGYFEQWQAERNGEILSDSRIRLIAENMVKNSKIKLKSLELHSNATLPYNARYLDWLNTIILNPYIMRKYRSDDIERKVTLTIAHELGHAFDPDLPAINVRKRALEKAVRTTVIKSEVEEMMEEIIDLTIQAENNAFDYAYRFLPEDFPLEQVEKERKLNEAAYIGSLDAKKERYLQSI